MGSRADEGRAVRGDRADGQGVRQPACGSSCSTCSPRRREPSTSSPGRAASRRRTPPSTCRRCTPRGWSRARARAPACATRSPATRRSRCGWRCATPRSPGSAEVERAARDYLGEDVDAIGRDELIARLREGDVVLVDVRPPRSSRPGTSRARARSRSTSSSDRLAELPADREIVAYCRGPFCAYAHEAVRASGGRPRGAAPRTAGPNGGWPRRAPRAASSRMTRAIA